MINSQLFDYVRQQLAVGVTKEQLQKTLASQGWNEQDINGAFATLGNNNSTAPAALQTSLPIWKRVLFFLGYIAIYYLVSKTAATLLVMGTAIAMYWYGLEVNFPTWIFTAEKVAAAVLGILAAWIVGRYFHWTVFRKNQRVSKPHNKFVKITFYGTSFVVVLLFVLLLTPSALGLFFKDISPIDDSDLHLPTVSIPDDQNAYSDLVAAGDALGKTYDTQQLRDIVEGKSWDATFAAQAVAGNTTALSLFVNAVRKPSFQDPAAANPDTVSLTTPLTSMGSWRNLIRFNSLAALYLSRAGKSTKGLQVAMMGVDVAQKIEVSQNFLIGWLVAVSIKKQTLQTIQDIVASSTISTKDLKGVANSLKSYSNDASGLVKAHKIGYYEQKSTISYLAHGNVADGGTAGSMLSLTSQIDRTNFYFHPNQSTYLQASDIRLRVANAQSACDNLMKTEPTRVMPSNLFLLYITPNAIGKVIHDAVSVSLDDTRVRACQENVLLSATRLLAALKAYQQDNKKLPASLGELVPTYLSDMPLDPYSGQGFKYDPTKKTIYSIGQNKNDVGGSIGDSWELMENPTFSISF